MSDVGPFRRQVRDAKSYLGKTLRSGIFAPADIMFRRAAIEIMERQLKDDPSYLLDFADRNLKKGHSPAELWYAVCVQRAKNALDHEYRDPKAFEEKIHEYLVLGIAMRRRIREAPQYISRYTTVTVRENEATKEVVDQISLALQVSANLHRFDPDFLTVSSPDALNRMLYSERFDLAVLFRIVSSVPGEVSIMERPRPAARSTSEQFIEFAIGCVPIVGAGVAIYESIMGHDLFGNPLTEVERGVLGYTVLLPVVYWFMSSERAVLSAARASRIYGGETKMWSRTFAVGERLAKEPNAYAKLKAARQTVMAGGTLSRAQTAELDDIVRAIDLAKADTLVPTVLSKRATDAFERLTQHSGRWIELDANAVERLGRLKRQSAFQGQLLEEILENRMAVWIRDPAGLPALGLQVQAGEVRFIPGRLIRSENGLQLTDGMIVKPLGGNQYEVIAIIEAKSGQYSARGLYFRTHNKKRLTKNEKVELRKAAEDAFQELNDHARLTGDPITKTVEDLEEEILLAEKGGQFRSDIERISELPVFFAGEEVKLVRFSPVSTRYLAVVPMDVTTRGLAEELADAGIKNFTILGMSYTEKELNAAAKVLDTSLNPKKKRR